MAYNPSSDAAFIIEETTGPRRQCFGISSNMSGIGLCRRVEEFEAFEGQPGRLFPYINTRIDVFAAMNAVARGPHDFRHIGPHGIKTLAGKGAAVSASGHRNAAGLRLEPGGRDDVRGEIGITQTLVFGVDHSGQDVLRAILDAGQTALALVNVIEISEFVVQGVRLVAVQAVHAALFHTVLAAGTVFPPLNNTQLSFWPEARRSGLRMDVEFCRHNRLS